MDKIKVAYVLDNIGTLAQDPEDEVRSTIQSLMDFGLPIDLVGWGHDMRGAVSRNIDLLIIDYGGLSQAYNGSEDMALFQLRSACQWAQEHPGKLMMIDTQYTYEMYHKEMESEFGQLVNVFYAYLGRTDYIKTISEWFGVTADFPDTPVKLVMPSAEF